MKPESNEQLLPCPPCPRCGGESHVKSVWAEYGMKSSGNPHINAECLDYRHCGLSTQLYHTAEEAIEWWSKPFTRTASWTAIERRLETAERMIHACVNDNVKLGVKAKQFFGEYVIALTFDGS